jgi:catechol 2,3-dioxygenase-like lactoylglutathione lyase family enzyme
VPPTDATLTFDHVHLVSRNPAEASRWYVDMLGARVLKDTEVFGIAQIYLSFGEALLVVRGLRAGETASAEMTRRWGMDHFGFRVSGDFDRFCSSLRARGVRFTLDPVDINAATRVAYIEGPDAVRIELLLRREWPDLVQFGVDAGTGIANAG